MAYEPELTPVALLRVVSLYEQVWGDIQAGARSPREGWWWRACPWKWHCAAAIEWA